MTLAMTSALVRYSVLRALVDSVPWWLGIVAWRPLRIRPNGALYSVAGNARPDVVSVTYGSDWYQFLGIQAGTRPSSVSRRALQLHAHRRYSPFLSQILLKKSVLVDVKCAIAAMCVSTLSVCSARARVKAYSVCVRVFRNGCTRAWGALFYDLFYEFRVSCIMFAHAGRFEPLMVAHP